MDAQLEFAQCERGGGAQKQDRQLFAFDNAYGGKSKAAFFGKHGFVVANWQVLARALQEHAQNNPVLRTDPTAFGRRYIVDGTLLAPDGTLLNVRSVWFITTESTIPRFATAHPLNRKTP